MKKVILVHGWEATSKSDFFPWLKKELDKGKIWSYFPDMPNSEEPKIEEWIPFLKKNIKKIDNETILIGHSIGCQAVLRYLETLPKNAKVKRCIFIAPWMKLDEETIKEEGEEVIEIAKPWMKTPINWEKVKSHCTDFVCIFSDNDPYVPLSNKEFFKIRLNAKSIVLHNRYHF
ncbi:MAG: alpha/beta fold hydrolase, partial [Nanoarchaeota archaeon]